MVVTPFRLPANMHDIILNEFLAIFALKKNCREFETGAYRMNLLKVNLVNFSPACV